MKKTKENIQIHKLSIYIVIINVITFIITWLLTSEKGSLFLLTFITYKAFFLSYIMAFVLLNIIFDSYAFDRRRITENAYSLSLSSLISMLVFYFLDTLAYRKFYSIRYIIIAIAICTIENIIYSKYANRYLLKNSKKKRTLIYYKEDEDLTNIKSLVYFDYKYQIIKKIKSPSKIERGIKCDTVFVSGIKTSIRDEIVKECLEQNIEVFVFPNVGDILISGGKYVEELSMPMLKIDRSINDYFYETTKRMFDVILSIIGIVITSPFMAITALAIKLYDGGPVLYKQKRLTKDRKEFYIYKFRSMKVDAEKDGIARLSSKNDTRITPVGKVIRAVRFDELPQLINILKGDMSVVGPRPERPEITEQYEKENPVFGLRLQIKGGLTGYAQVYGKYNTNPLEKLKMDLYYINKKSIFFDIKICIMTLKILFMKESTEAIEEGDIIAGEKHE